MGASRLTAKSYTEEEVREIAERQNLVGYPHLALMREKLSVKAKNEPKFRFYNLKRLVVETETLKCAWAQVRANKGAPGVDGVTIEDIGRSEGGAEAFIAGIQKELHEKTYRASPVRRKYIEKANGKLRPLGIPTVKDRVVQCAVKLIIEPIFEADFHDYSFGFRPNRSAQQAVDRIAAEIKSGKRQVYDADLSSYFDTIPHDKLFLALRTRITDSGVLSLIRQWLKSNSVEPNGVQKNPKGKGTPQGGVISPLLSNIYLHWFETCAMLVAKATNQVMSIVRYADDFVILARKLQGEFVRKVESELEGRFGLVVNRDKTKVLDMRAEKAALGFLGYEFRFVRSHYGEGKYLTFGPSMKSVKKVCAKVKEQTLGIMKPVKNEEIVQRVNKILVGWDNYFQCGYPTRMFDKVNWYVRNRLYLHFNRKSQRGYVLKYAPNFYSELQAMGLHRLQRRRK